MRDVRRRIDPAWAECAGLTIARTVGRLPEFGSARVVGLYRPLPGEVPVSAIEVAARAAGKTLFLPAWMAGERRYAWVVWPTGGALVKGPFGVEEPLGAVPAACEPDVALVPGLAFDARGRRLGQGGGHFDRLLASGSSLRIGLAFSRQIVTRVPDGPDDVPMHRVVTEGGLLATAQTEPPGTNYVLSTSQQTEI